MSQAVNPATYEGINMTAVFSPFYWGTVISLVLSGITFLQAYNYFPSRDRLPIQLLAGAMISLDIASTGLISQGFYYYVVPHFGSLLPLSSLVPTLAAECALSVVIILISQSYFAWQIYIINTNGKTRFIIPAIVMVFAITSFAGGLGCATVMFLDNTQILVTRSYRFSVTAGIAKGSSAVADIVATIALCYQLGSSRTGIKQTDSLLKTLMGYIVQRGVLVTMIQTLFLVIFFSTASHAWWLALHVNVTRLYANTFFAMLNGREGLKTKRSSTAFMSASHSEGTYQGGSYTYPPSGVKFPTASDTQSHEKAINVDKTVIIADM